MLGLGLGLGLSTLVLTRAHVRHGARVCNGMCVCVLVTALFTSRAIWPAPRAPLAIKLELGYSCVCRLLDEVAACIWDQLRGHSCMGCGLRTDCVLFFSEFPGPDGIASACIVDALHRLLRLHALALAAGTVAST